MVVGIARAIAPFERGIDCLSPMANNVARMFKAEGYTFVGQYLEVLTPAVRDGIFAAGLAILPITEAITHVPLNETVGTERGKRSKGLAVALGIPATVHITIDLESTQGSAEDVAAYVDATHDAFDIYGSMLYVGADQPLNGAELFARKPNRYWRSGSFVPEPACRWCCIQLTPLDQIIHTQRVDVNVIQADGFGRTPILWWPK
ncbi:MAG: DUF1906 domain-containing protein [Patescibacteria group bacterium]|nr:DUF1906 domain-containing protein [Patescibacteria group bacterium]